MIKKSAISGDYIINILDSGTVQVLKKCDADGIQSYSACPNTLGALREIADSEGFTINEKSNTRSNGAKLVDFINANAPCVAKDVIESQSAGEDITPDAVLEPSETESVSDEAVTEQARDEEVAESAIEPAEPEIAIKPSTLTNPSNEELTEEEMAIIEDLLKRIETLEARVGALEDNGAFSATSVTSNPDKITGEIHDDIYPANYFSLYKSAILSNGRRGYLVPIRTSDWNCTVGQTRNVADMFGYKYDSKTKREALGWELVSKYGDGKWAFIGNKAVDANGETYNFIETRKLYDQETLAFLMNKFTHKDYGRFVDLFKGNPFTVDPSWSEEEIRDKLVKFIVNLVYK